MKILARGSNTRLKELQEKLGDKANNLTQIDDLDLISDNVNDYDLIFDLKFDDHPDRLKYYAHLKNKPVIVGAVKQQLAKAQFDFKREIECNLIGMNTLTGFINRSLVEVSLLDSNKSNELDELMKNLGWDYKLVQDRIGMVTPRVIFMIINEACYTLQEGTADMKDIDTSMKLGTNYPFGPFEWADKIGIKHVYETLEAMYADTHDERYKVCPLLKTKYLKGETFYSV
ncbi:MAG: 3-hydroxyacyl-CoA dehydrogenase family protein [Bacteroidia bacterium]